MSLENKPREPDEAAAHDGSDWHTGAAQPELRGLPVEPRVDTPAVRLRARLILTDLIALVVAWALAVPFAPTSVTSVTGTAFATFLVVGAPAITMPILGALKLYRARECAVRALQNARLLKGVATSTVVAVIAAELIGLPWTVWPFLVGGVAAFLSLVLGRALFNLWVAKRRRRGASQWPVVLVGGNEESSELQRLFDDHPEYGFGVVGVVGSRPAVEAYHPAVPWLGELHEATSALDDTQATGAVIASTALKSDELNRVVRDLLKAGAHVRVSNGIRGIAQRRLRTAPVGYEPLYYVERWQLTTGQLRVKRALDTGLTLLGMIVAAPLMLAVTLAIKVSEPSAPVLFRQERLGLHAQPFQLLKFRTMVVDAEQRLPQLKEENARSGPLFKMQHDPRVTRIGRFLRASSLDELPQLLNVLKGEMSLVGPRPALHEEVEQFSDRLRERMTVLPGITGLWQVEARDNPSFRSYERLDLFYVENWSVGLDLSILLGTSLVVMDRTLQAVKGLSTRSIAHAPEEQRAGASAPLE